MYKEIKMIDIVFPKDNEKEFIATALKLGYKKLILCYELSEFKKIKLIKDPGIILDYAIICMPNKVKEARKHSDLVIIKSSNKDRQVLEQSRPDIIFSLEKSRRSDFIYHRNSGLNQVYCKLAKKNHIAIGLSFHLIITEKNKPKILGRMMQNIRFCKKYNIQVILASFTSDPFNMRNPSDLRSLGTVLGMSTQQLKDNFNIVDQIIKDNKIIRRSGLRGIEVIE